MKKILQLSFLLMTCLIYAQSPSKNFIKTKVYKVPYHGTETLAAKDTLVNITYFNGLGQPVQSIAVGAGGNGQDIITPITYENGRKIKSYLPYADPQQTVANPNYRDNDALISNLNNYYVSKFPGELSSVTPNPYSQVALEASPVERAYRTSAPGEAWKLNTAGGSDRSIKSDVLINEDSDNVLLFKVNFVTENSIVRTDTTSLACTGYYLPGTLTKTITRNENWDGNYNTLDNTTEEYTDNFGHLVLKRTYNQNLRHDTYYVYDKFDNLTYVIPPLASDQILNPIVIYNPAGISASWDKLVVVDQKLADEYEKALKDYNSPTVLAADLLNKYGATGGFSVVPDANGNLVLSINIQTNKPMPYRTGMVADLKSIGKFPDAEIGRIQGDKYEYIFTITSNQLYVASKDSGEVPSISATLTSGQKLSYTKNYNWSILADITSEQLEDYTTLLKDIPNEQQNITYIENDFNAVGGLTLSIDDQDNVEFSINVNAGSELALRTGNVFPLDISRSIADRTLGTITGDKYSYDFLIEKNYLVIKGYGTTRNINLSGNKAGTLFLVNQQPLQGLCYIYHYDKRNRQIEKHIPEKGWTQTVYDKLDRPVLVQDENLRIKTTTNWLYTKYDLWNRVVYSGEYTDTRTRKTIQQAVDNDTSTPLNETRVSSTGVLVTNTVLYTRNAFPTTGTQRTVNYYDDYTFVIGRFTMPTVNLYGDAITTNVKGLSTCSMVNVLGTNSWESSTFYYEDRGLLISTQYSNQYLSTSDFIDQHIDFTGQALAAMRKHIKGSTTLIVEDLYTYNNVGQVLKQTEKINNGTEQLIAYNKYNELGTLVEKKVGGTTTASTYEAVTTSLQTVKYTYNLRGWLKSINNPDASLASTPNNDLFAFKINYNTTDLTGSAALYNGNIAETIWRSKTDNKKRGYSYHYDALNRLTDANYVGNYTLTQYPGQTENYTEGGITYDKQGNIQHLDRYGLKTNTIDKIDALTYTYMPFSNKLLSVSDAASSAGFNNGSTETLPDYNYDLNGNLTSDANKRITSITYNYLDLPVTVQKSSSVYINNTYNAIGGKVEKKYSDGESITTTQYANGFVYQNGVLQYFPHAEGYVQKDSNGNFTYVYQYKDHLGNVRLSYFKNTATNALEVVEEENYYAFGMKHQGYNNVTSSNANNVAQKIEFNGKEYQDELSLNWYDYGARNYDPTVGRWFNVDPLAEKYRRWTPYNYCMNNPVYFTDPDGMSVKTYDGAAARELVSQMQANMERVQRQQYVFNTYGWPSSFDSFTGINNMGNGGGGVGLGQLLEFTEGIPDSSVKVGPLGNATMQNTNVEEMGSICAEDEPPVNLFSSTETYNFQKVVEDFEKKAVVGDNIFRIFGHGNIGFISNHSNAGDMSYIQTAEDFKAIMTELSPSFKNIVNNSNATFTLILYSCMSGASNETKISIAEKISKAYPNATVISFDGYIFYGGDKSMVGVSTNITHNNNLGKVKYFHNGLITKTLESKEYFK